MNYNNAFKISLFISLFVFCYSQDDEVKLLAKHSFKAPFSTVGRGLAFWDLGGTTAILDDYIRLTPAAKSRVGWMWNTQPVDSENWKISFRFQIHGGGKLGADGIALWYTTRVLQESPAYGAEAKWDGIGIFFDTFDNNNNGDNPRVVLVPNRNNVAYSTEEDGRNLQIASCDNVDIRGKVPITVLITYKDKTLDLSLDFTGRGEFKRCFHTPITLKKNGFFGITAETGGLTDNHDVYWFQFWDFEKKKAKKKPPVNQDIPKETPNNIPNKKKKEETFEVLEEKRDNSPDKNKKKTPPPYKRDIEKQKQNKKKKFRDEIENINDVSQRYNEPILEDDDAEEHPSHPIYKQIPEMMDLLQEVYKQIQFINAQQSHVLGILQATDIAISEDRTHAQDRRRTFNQKFIDLLSKVATKDEVDLVMDKSAEIILSEEKNKFNDASVALNQFRQVCSTTQDSIAASITSLQNIVSELSTDSPKGLESGESLPHLKAEIEKYYQTLERIESSQKPSSLSLIFSIFALVQIILALSFIASQSFKKEQTLLGW